MIPATLLCLFVTAHKTCEKLGLVHVCASSLVMITHPVHIIRRCLVFQLLLCCPVCTGALNSSSGAASSPLVGVVILVDTAVVVVYPLKKCTSTWYGLILSAAER